MKDLLLIGGGAFAGANARYLVNQFAARHLEPVLPFGTLIANVTGSLLLGAFLAISTERAITDPAWRLLIAVGFCGSYTTFSSYAFETVRLAEQGQWWAATGNLLANNVLCLVAVIAGIALGRLSVAT